MAGKILVVGATGTVGAPLVKQLAARGESVRAASRHGVGAPGVEAVRVDLTDSSSVAAAMQDVDRAYFLVPSGRLDSKELMLPIIAAAAARRIKVVLQSVFGVDADDSIPYRQVEIALQKSGTPFVILRPNWFSDNFHTYWKAGVASGQIAVPAGDGKTSFIDARDIAESAAAALTTNTFDGRAFNLTGPEALSYADAAGVLSHVLGRAIHYTAIDDEAFVAGAMGAGVPADYAKFLAAIFYPVRQGWTAAVTSDVATLTGSAPRSVETYARDHVAELTK